MVDTLNIVYTQEVGGSSPSSPTILSTEEKPHKLHTIKKENYTQSMPKCMPTHLEIGSRLPFVLLIYLCMTLRESYILLQSFIIVSILLNSALLLLR